jgi:hypothetical protein
LRLLHLRGHTADDTEGRASIHRVHRSSKSDVHVRATHDNCDNTHRADPLDAAIERIDPALNAVVIRWFDHARETAANELPNGPFRGVPFLLNTASSSR